MKTSNKLLLTAFCLLGISQIAGLMVAKQGVIIKKDTHIGQKETPRHEIILLDKLTHPSLIFDHFNAEYIIDSTFSGIKVIGPEQDQGNFDIIMADGLQIKYKNSKINKSESVQYIIGIQHLPSLAIRAENNIDITTRHSIHTPLEVYVEDDVEITLKVDNSHTKIIQKNKASVNLNGSTGILELVMEDKAYAKTLFCNIDSLNIYMEDQAKMKAAHISKIDGLIEDNALLEMSSKWDTGDVKTKDKAAIIFD